MGAEPYYADESVTLYHGDCREIAEWLVADVLVTDPPYGMAFVSSWTTRRPIAGDLDTAARDYALVEWGARPALVFGTWRVPRPTATRQLIVWHKYNVGPGIDELLHQAYGFGCRMAECCPEGVIVDPFAGSGATLLAARNQGRRSIGVEVEERYCELIARRMSQGVLDVAL